MPILSDIHYCNAHCTWRCAVQADEGLEYINSLIPSHHEDMALIEQLDRLLEAARHKARTELAHNLDAAAAIDAELDRLDATLAECVESSSRVKCNGIGSGAATGSRDVAAGSLPLMPSSPLGSRTTSPMPLTPAESRRLAGAESVGAHGTSSPPKPRSPSPSGRLAAASSTTAAGGGGPRLRFQASTTEPLSRDAALGSGVTRRPSLTDRHSDAAGGSSATRDAALAQCNAILQSMDALRGMLYRQAKALDFLRRVGRVLCY